MSVTSTHILKTPQYPDIWLLLELTLGGGGGSVTASVGWIVGDTGLVVVMSYKMLVLVALKTPDVVLMDKKGSSVLGSYSSYRQQTVRLGVLNTDTKVNLNE